MSVLALALVCLGLARQGDAWAQLWTELERLRGEELPAAEAEVLRAHLGEALRELPATEVRAELLGAALEAHSGRDASALASRLAALQPSPFTAREHWFLADLLPRGEARARAVQVALEAPSRLSRWQFFLAWNTAVDEARALRLEQSSLPIQLNLHHRYQAEWSAMDLALTYKQLGLSELGDGILAEAIAREGAAGRPTHNLWEQRGILALGSGDSLLARDYLGRALAQGSEDAGLLLSRLDLMDGKTEQARRGFRALILNQPPPDWAWRGWGLSLLPPSFAPSAKGIPPSTSH